MNPNIELRRQAPGLWKRDRTQTIMGRKRGCRTPDWLSRQATIAYGGRRVKLDRSTTLGAVAKRYPRSIVIVETRDHMTCSFYGRIYDDTGSKSRVDRAWLMPGRKTSFSDSHDWGHELALY